MKTNRHQYFTPRNSFAKRVRISIAEFFMNLRASLRKVFYGKATLIKNLGKNIEDLRKAYDARIKELNTTISKQGEENGKLSKKIDWLKRSIASLTELKANLVDHNGEFATRYSEVSEIVDVLGRIYTLDGNTEVIDEALKSVIQSLTYRLDSLASNLRTANTVTERANKFSEHHAGEIIGMKNVLGAVKMEVKSKLSNAA
jgi:chromosome segregation ATPase